MRYSTSKYSLTLKTGLGVTQDHSNWCHSKAWERFAIHCP